MTSLGMVYCMLTNAVTCKEADNKPLAVAYLTVVCVCVCECRFSTSCLNKGCVEVSSVHVCVCVCMCVSRLKTVVV